jgi:acyl carrier protein
MVIFLESRGGETTMANELEGRILNLVADQLGVDIGEVTPDASILEDLGADSLDVVELVMSLEDAFDIEVEDEDVEGMRTIGDLQQYVIGHVA